MPRKTRFLSQLLLRPTIKNLCQAGDLVLRALDVPGGVPREAPELNQLRIHLQNTRGDYRPVQGVFDGLGASRILLADDFDVVVLAVAEGLVIRCALAENRP